MPSTTSSTVSADLDSSTEPTASFSSRPTAAALRAQRRFHGRGQDVHALEQARASILFELQLLRHRSCASLILCWIATPGSLLLDRYSWIATRGWRGRPLPGG